MTHYSGMKIQFLLYFSYTLREMDKDFEIHLYF